VSSTLDAGQASPPSEQPPRPTPPGVPLGTVIAFLLGGLAFIAVAVIALVFVSKDGGSASASDFHATPLPEGMPRPDFTLTDQNGQPYDFGAETQGQLTLVFFGYTNCPDVCPLTMDFISQALDQVEVAAKVVFITTDPARDTPERLTQWLTSIDKDFVGLTGTRDEVIAAQRALDVTVAVPEDPDPKGNYVVGHSSQVFVFTEDDQAHLLYGFGTRLGDWAEDLPKIAANKDWQGTAP
jgi:protein SCO1